MFNHLFSMEQKQLFMEGKNYERQNCSTGRKLCTRQSPWVETEASRTGKTRIEQKRQADTSLPPLTRHRNARFNCRTLRCTCKSVCSWLLIRTHSLPVARARYVMRLVFPMDVSPCSKIGVLLPETARAISARLLLTVSVMIYVGLAASARLPHFTQ